MRLSTPNGFGWVKRLISGVMAFIINMAKETPSGYPPPERMHIVSKPHPMPNAIFPLAVMGDVT